MAMSVAELAERLNAEAARRGITPEELLEELTSRLPSPAPTPSPTGMARRHLAFAASRSSTSGRTAREADDLLAEGFGRS